MATCVHHRALATAAVRGRCCRCACHRDHRLHRGTADEHAQGAAGVPSPPAMPGLGWTCVDLCSFAYVTCAPSSVSVAVTAAGWTVSGSLPELPATGVDSA
ncbi:hypothetical protein NESM_000791200 [Novymonas esmeraldas]|uniref:Uncharacterized protein n=1 Tax=Novymonas esmeraldas TaxID=1808958 RepID=A0AAW0EWZ4_9TRYP